MRYRPPEARPVSAAHPLSFLLTCRAPRAHSCVATYLSPLVEKGDKDEYASSGYLNASERTRLLSEWAPRPSIKAMLEREVGPEMDKLHKARQECAASPKDQRYMPATLDEAQELGGQDAEAARKVTMRSRRAAASTTLRAGPAVALRPPLRRRRRPHRSKTAAALAAASVSKAIQKRRRS